MAKLMSHALTLFVCLGLFTCLPLQAQSFLGCEQLLTSQNTLSAPDPIPHTPTALHPNEIHAAGEMMSPTSTRNLPEGKYVFLVSSTSEVIFSPVYQIKNWGHERTGLVTHKSLLNKLQSSPTSILGSGEFQIHSGVVSSVSNRSGNFRGSEIHLKYSLRQLKALGLPLQPQTEVIIILAESEDDWGHTPQSMSYDQFQLQLREGIAEDPRLNELAQKYLKLYRILSKHFPAKVAGRADLMAFLDFYSPVVMTSALYTYSFDFLEPLRLMHTVDGMYFGLTSVHRNQKDNIYSMFDDVIKLLQSARSAPPAFRDDLLLFLP